MWRTILRVVGSIQHGIQQTIKTAFNFCYCRSCWIIAPLFVGVFILVPVYINYALHTGRASLVYARVTSFLLLLPCKVWKACIHHGNDGQVCDILHSPESEILIFTVEKCFDSCKWIPANDSINRLVQKLQFSRFDLLVDVVRIWRSVFGTVMPCKKKNKPKQLGKL